jgi:starch synthase
LKQIILSHSGKQHSYQVAEALNREGYLKKFYTSSYIRSAFLQRLINRSKNQYWSRRFLKGLSGNVVSANWRYEFKEILYRKLGSGGAEVNQLVYERDVNFDNFVSRRLASQAYDIFWGFQGSCLQSLRAATKASKPAVCEMTIAHLPFANKILSEEAKLNPQWADSIDFSNFPASFQDRLITEPHQATNVVAISEFLKRTLVEDGIAAGKIRVLPLGCPVEDITFSEDFKSIQNRPLKLLFAGRVTQRKGMSYLLEAMQSFKKNEIELHIIGNIHGTGSEFHKLNKHYQYFPGISQQQLFDKYSEYDILILPSLVEGFGLVSIEAMCAGLPVITTPNTNAAEILQDGFNGFLVPIRDSSAILNALHQFRDMDDNQFQLMRMNARKTALNYSWDAYSNNLINYLKEF